MDLEKKPKNSRTVPWAVNRIKSTVDLDPKVITSVIRYVYEQTRLALANPEVTSVEISGIGSFKTTMHKAVIEFLKYRYAEGGTNMIKPQYLEGIRGKVNKLLDDQIPYSNRTKGKLIKAGFLDDEGNRINPTPSQGPEEPVEGLGGVQEQH